MQSWVLVGMMGSGKSAVGRGLAASAERAFVDTDQLLQQRFGRNVSSIFSTYGEETFRAHETAILKSLEPGNDVVSTGGGIITRQENWVELRRLGRIIYLKAHAETLTKRLEISKRKRPLLQVDNWEERIDELLKARSHLYEMADISVEVDGLSIEDAVQQILVKVQ